ncbi:unnamed protein product [Chrysoparadoxa australica]
MNKSQGHCWCGTKEGRYVWCNLDPCGMICAGMTWMLIMFSQYAVSTAIILPWMGLSFWGWFHLVSFNGQAGLCFLVHMKAMMTDPGAVVSKAAALLSEDVEVGDTEETTHHRRWCRRCDSFKPRRAHHCSVCRRCIVKMDHHCPWINNCVGVGNHKFFILFVAYIFGLSSYAIALVCGRFLTCARSDEKDACGTADSNVVVVLLMMESMLFGMFTFCMMLDQWGVVTTNQSSIDKLKGETHVVSHGVNEVFGGDTGCRLDWLLPTKVAFPPGIWEEVMGYRVKEQDLELKVLSHPAEESLLVDGSSKEKGPLSGDIRERKNGNVPGNVPETTRLLEGTSGAGEGGGMGGAFAV